MLALTVHFLAGRYAASRYNDRSRPEWPPHPARLFSALVDAWAWSGRDEFEAEALRWLEEQPPPRIVATGAELREVADHDFYVPVNDPALVLSLNEQKKLFDKFESWREARAAVASGSAGRAASRKEQTLRRQYERALDALRKKARAGRKLSKKDFEVAESLFPERRTKQARKFPVALPHLPRVDFIWEAEPPPELARALDRLSARVARLGHSSSPVSVELLVQESPPSWEDLLVPHRAAPGSGVGEARRPAEGPGASGSDGGAQAIPELQHWLPSPDGLEVLRVTGPGQLQALVDAYELHRGVEPRILPHRKQRYRKASAGERNEQAPGAAHREDWEWLVLRFQEKPRLPLTRAEDVARAARGALLRYFPEGVHAAELFGHLPNGRRGEGLHLAFVPLPFVGHRHATGLLLGVAVLLPPGLGAEKREAVYVALARWRFHGFKLVMGRAGDWTLEYLSLPAERATLRASTWTHPSRDWVSATPVALDRNPGNLRSPYPDKEARAWMRAEETVRRSLRLLGYPEPDGVDLRFAPYLPGSRPASSWAPFPSVQKPGSPRRVLVHAHLRFPEPVRGPLLLGAGRYFGLGLFRPV